MKREKASEILAGNCSQPALREEGEYGRGFCQKSSPEKHGPHSAGVRHCCTGDPLQIANITIKYIHVFSPQICILPVTNNYHLPVSKSNIMGKITLYNSEIYVQKNLNYLLLCSVIKLFITLLMRQWLNCLT